MVQRDAEEQARVLGSASRANANALGKMKKFILDHVASLQKQDADYELADKLAKLNTKCKKLAIAKDALAHEKRDLEEKLKTSQDEFRNLDAKFTDLTRDLKAVNAEKAGLQVIIAAHDETSSKKDTLVSENASLTKNIAELQKTLDARLKRVTECEDAVKVKVAENKKLSDLLAETTTAFEDLTATCAKKSEEFKQISESWETKSKESNASLKSEKDNVTKLQEEVKQLQQKLVKASRVATLTDNKVVIPIDNRATVAAKEAVVSDSEDGGGARQPDAIDVSSAFSDAAASSSLTASQRDSDVPVAGSDDEKVDITTMSQTSAPVEAPKPLVPAVSATPAATAASGDDDDEL